MKSIHWYGVSVSSYALYPNLNRYIDPEDPRTKNKWEAA